MKVINCECGALFEIENSEAEEFETVECPQCGTDCYTSLAENSTEEQDSEEYDVDQDLKFD